MNDNAITIVFIAPSKVKKLFLFVETMLEPITAACAEPREGKNEQSGAESIDARIIFREKFFLVVWVVCFGIFCFFIMLVTREEPPNNPVKSGKSG